MRVISQTFGQTECATAAVLPFHEQGDRRSVGKAAPGYELRVVEVTTVIRGVGAMDRHS